MIIRSLPYIIYRSYPDFGYLTDNRNFGYDTASRSCMKVGDLLLSEVASQFYSVLSCTPQDIDTIVVKLCKIFPGALKSSIREDAVEFYSDLSAKGFVYIGNENINHRSRYFSYDNKEPYYLNLNQQQSNDSVYSNTFGKTYQLSRVHIDISGRCNENCIHCYIPSNRKCGIMTLDLFEQILYQCKKLNVINLTISGGEPMLNPHLRDFLLQCKQNNFSVNILSNLTNLSGELLALIADNPLISIQTSLYAMDEKVHDTITRSKGSFKKTLNSIELLHGHNIPMQINCPIMKQNMRYYKDVLLYAKSMNIEADSDYSLFGSFDCSKNNLACRLSIEEISELLLNREESEKLIDMKIKYKDSRTEICPICKTSLCVSNSGDIYPCEGWQSMVLGNIKQHSLKSIWEKSPIVKHFRELTFGNFPKCITCEDKNYCSPCLIMNANENPNGDYEKINPFTCCVASMKKQAITLSRGFVQKN